MTRSTVNPKRQPVKRPYRSALRDEQALATRRRIRDAAEQLFLRDGYATTSMTAIADAAGVSRPTVFNTFGTKAELVKEIADVRLAGDDEPIDVFSRPKGRAMLAARDPDRVLRLHARYTAEIMQRVAPILALIRDAAAIDADAAALLRTQEDGRLFGMGATVDRLVELGAIRKGRDADRAKRSLWLLSGLEPWQLARQSGWSLDAYTDWYYRCARAVTLGDS